MMPNIHNKQYNHNGLAIFARLKVEHNGKVRKMNITIKNTALLLLTALTLVACSSAPAPKNDPYSNPDDQRSRGHQTQDELSSETSK